MPQEYLSTRQAAELLRASEATIRRWSDRGELPVQRVGRRRERRFRPDDVERFQQVLQAAGARDVAGSQALIGGVPVEPFTHLAVFYDTDEGRIRMSGPFLADGLRLGQPCFLMACGAELDGYLEHFARSPGLDLDEALRSGLLFVADGPGKTIAEAIDFWERSFWKVLDRPGVLIRAVGEMGSERSTFVSEAEMLAYEAALNLSTKRFPCVLLCQYDVRRFDGPALLAALRAHPDILARPLRNLIT